MARRATDMSILVIGSGFAGIGLGIALKKAGFHDFTLLERADDLGGVWRDNTYPGAACDVPSRFYSYSFAAHWPWTKRFAPQGEILAYARHVAESRDILRHIVFGADVVSATFDDTRGRWSVEARDGRRFTARVLVSAVGLFNRLALPSIEGREIFAGPAFHSAQWRHDVDLAGKRVAVIGTGASAVQFVPEIAKIATRVSVFQRTAQYVLPKDEGRPGPSGEIARTSRAQVLYDRLKIFVGFEKMVPRRLSAEKTARASEGFRDYLRGLVKDPALLAKVMPAQELGCKRVLQSNDWYPALQRANVDLVTDAIARIEADGVRTKDGALHEADVIIYGTGFTPTDFLSGLEVRGRGGLTLRDAWREKVSAYLGMSVPGFPNFFIMYGPNTNVAGSIIYVLERQARYIAGCVSALATVGARSMEVKPDRLARFNDFITGRLTRTVIATPNCTTYFKTASGHVPTNWPGAMTEYAWRTRRVRTADYDFAPMLEREVAERESEAVG